MAKKKNESNFFSDIVKELNDENTVLMSEEDTSAEFSEYIDTGSYTLNALLSGSMYGGVPDNKVVIFNGLEATGKTFFVLSIAQHFMKQKKNGGLFLFDTEQDKTKKMLQERGIDIARVVNSQPITVQEFRYRCLQVIDNYRKVPESQRPPVCMILDSLGQLSTTKEIEDTEAGKETKDMTRAQLIKASFRVIRAKLARAKIPLLVTNHVYAKIGSLFPDFEGGGGSGPKYSGDIIVFLGKSQFKEDNEVKGTIIKMKLYKSRLTREKAEAATLLRHDGGLDRYYGLVDIAVKAGLVTRTSKTGKTVQWFNGKKYSETQIYNEPEKYFTEDIMVQLEEACNKQFRYTNTMVDFEKEPDVNE